MNIRHQVKFLALCLFIVMTGLVSGCGGGGGSNPLADVTPPTITAGPVVSATTSTATTLSVTINENGTGYYIVQAATATAPNAAAVQAGTAFALTANVAASANISGLTPSTAYTIYVIAKDTENNVQSAVSSVAVTTSAAAVITDITTGMTLLKVDGGTYTMGDTFGDGFSAELPTHQVTIGDFYIGKYEVTQGEWQTVMTDNTSGLSATPSYFSACGANCPVEQVSWDDIQIFISRLNALSGTNYRLPTEAEWEYAARSGGLSEKYSGGSDINAVAWYSVNSGSTTHLVGQKQANGLGLYDMSGNVWEWVSDWYGTYDSAAQTNPTGPTTGSDRVSRGGSFNHEAINIRASIRNIHTTVTRFPVLGFRLAAPLQ